MTTAYEELAVWVRNGCRSIQTGVYASKRCQYQAEVDVEGAEYETAVLLGLSEQGHVSFGNENVIKFDCRWVCLVLLDVMGAMYSML